MLRKIRFVDSKSQQHVKASPGAIPRQEPVQRFLYIFFCHLVFYEVTFKVEALCFIDNVALSRSRFSLIFFPHLLHSFWDRYSSCNQFHFSFCTFFINQFNIRWWKFHAKEDSCDQPLEFMQRNGNEISSQDIGQFPFQGSAILISIQKIQFKTNTRSEDVSINSMVLLGTSIPTTPDFIFPYCSNCWPNWASYGGLTAYLVACGQDFSTDWLGKTPLPILT